MKQKIENCINCKKDTCALAGSGNEAKINENNGCFVGEQVTEIEIQMIELDKNLFEGYISEVDDGIWVSAIKSKQIGNGDFSRLIKQLKEKYNWIKIPTPSNQMIEIAEHLGFIKKEEYFGEPFNEIGIIMFWSKNDNQK